MEIKHHTFNAESVRTISFDKNFLRQCVDVIQSVLSPFRFRLLRVVIGEFSDIPLKLHGSPSLKTSFSIVLYITDDKYLLLFGAKFQR